MSFRLGNFKVNISFMFFSVLCICALSDKSCIMLYGITASVLHETGHLSAALISGLPPDSLTLDSSGFRMNIPNLSENRKKCLIISFAGALTNLLLFVSSYHLSEGFALSNLALFILSLLPCDPFDGGLIIRTVLERYLSPHISDKILFILTLIILSVLTAFGVLILFNSRYNFSLLTLSMLVFTTICQRTLK